MQNEAYCTVSTFSEANFARVKNHFWREKKTLFRLFFSLSLGITVKPDISSPRNGQKWSKMVKNGSQTC